MPSSPYGPCSTGNTASIWPREVSVPFCSRAKNPSAPRAGSSTTSRASALAWTTGSSPPSSEKVRGSVPPTSHLPSLVIPTGIGSKRSVSSALSIPAVEMQEIECSSALPPYSTIMRCFVIIILYVVGCSPPTRGRPVLTLTSNKPHGGGSLRVRLPQP